MKRLITLLVFAAWWLTAQSVPVSQGTPANQAAVSRTQEPADPAMELVQQARKLNNDGKQAEALEAYRQALQKWPKSVSALLGAGATLDLMGRYDEGRKYLQRAIDAASPEQKPQAMKSM